MFTKETNTKVRIGFFLKCSSLFIRRRVSKLAQDSACTRPNNSEDREEQDALHLEMLEVSVPTATTITSPMISTYS